MKILAIPFFFTSILLFSTVIKAETCPTVKQITVECEEDFCEYSASNWFFESEELNRESQKPIKFASAGFILSSYNKYTDDIIGEMDYCSYKIETAKTIKLKPYRTMHAIITKKQKENWEHNGGAIYTCTQDIKNCQFTRQTH